MKNFFNTANLELGLCITVLTVAPILVLYFLYDAFGWYILVLPGLWLTFLTVGYIYKLLFCAKDTDIVNKVD